MANSKSAKNTNSRTIQKTIDLNTFDKLFSLIVPVAQSRLLHLLSAAQRYIYSDVDSIGSNSKDEVTDNVTSNAVTETSNRRHTDNLTRRAIWQECLLCLTVCLSSSVLSLKDNKQTM